MDVPICNSCGGSLGGRWGNRCYQCHPGGLPRNSYTRTCERCGQSFTIQVAAARREAGRFCSRACAYTAARGVERVVGTTYVRKDGYRVVKIGVRRYALEHRLVVEAAIGRPLRSDEEVHHVNGDKLNNRLENLEILSPVLHQDRHGDNPARRRSRVTLTCEQCGAAYERKASLQGKSRFCSGSCRSTFVSNQRWHPLPD